MVDALERFAPLPLQEGYDNSGLQIGLTEVEVSGALLCLDVTEEVVDEAVKKGCNMILSHHPLIFRKLAHISGQTYIERCVIKAIKNDIVIVSMHTNIDSAFGGVNHKIAEKIGLSEVRFIGGEKLVDGINGGNGVVGRLPESMASEDFVQHLKQVFKADCVQTNGLLDRPIETVAICGGAGSFLLGEALRVKADAFVTGEMSYHDYFGHTKDIQIAVLGHYQSEQFTTEVFCSILEPMGVKCLTTAVYTNPIVNY